MTEISSSKKPLVSIITPCYNGEKFIHRYFESILRQTYDNIEVIFVNDGSTDRTEEIALSYKEKLENKGYGFYYIYQENAGQAAAINKGLKIFKGDYLTWPDSDDWMSDDCIEKKVMYLEKNKDKAFVLCKTAIVCESDINKIKGYFYRKNTKNSMIFEDLLYQRDIYYAPGGYMVRSKMLLDVIPTRHIYEGRGGQNWQLLLPISFKYECGFLDDVLYYYLERENSHSHARNSYEKMVKLLYLYEDVQIKALESVQMPESEKKELIKEKQIYYARRRFMLALENNDKKVLAREYKILKKERALDKGIKQAYLETNHKIRFYIKLLFTKPKRVVRDIKTQLNK